MSDCAEMSMLLPVQYTVRQAKLYLDSLLWRGAAGTNSARVLAHIAAGELGGAMEARRPLLALIFEFLSAEAARGARDATIRNFFIELREFYKYVDGQGGDIELASVRVWYKRWVEHQYQRVQRRELNARVAYHQGKTVASLVARAMEVPFVSIAGGTRLKKPRGSKQALGREADKANLATMRGFGEDLLDVVSSLSFEHCMGPLPVVVTLQSNGSSKELWCGLQPADRVRAEFDAENLKVGGPKSIRAYRSRRSLHPELTERFKVINLRTTAEFLIFIAQTGINNAQALAMTMGDFRYESILGGYALRKYKHRRKGEVEFEIYGEYRPHFERYLDFRRRAFPPDYSELLFPVLKKPGDPLGKQLDITNVRRLLAGLERPFVSPQLLRAARVNWLARTVGDNAVVAQMAQHDVTTLERIYLKPNHQVAAVEWTKYFGTIDLPIQLAPGPGSCASSQGASVPERAEHFSQDAPDPDCRNPAGCVFCVHYRGIDSFDYAWSLASFKELKVLELSKYKNAGAGRQKDLRPIVIERVADILADFTSRSEVHASWVQEAKARCSEEDFHPRWSGFILLAEAMG